MKLREIAELLSLPLQGDREQQVSVLASLDTAGPNELSFVVGERYRRQLSSSKAGAVIVPRGWHTSTDRNWLISDEPYADFARLSQHFLRKQPITGVHPNAIVGHTVHIGDGVGIAPGAVIGDGVTLGNNVQIGSGCVIMDHVVIGADTIIDARVTVYHSVSIGERCRIMAGAVIGADGFGFAECGDGSWQKFEQLGTVCIADDVEIGANTTIDRGSLGDTAIGQGVIIDNLVQVAHNVSIGPYTAIAGCVGIAGSAQIGAYCKIGGAAGILGHLQICDGVTIAAKSLVRRSINEPGTYSSGMPLLPFQLWRKNAARIRHLDTLFRRVKQIEKQD